MKHLILAAALMSLAGTALAAGKPCEELKSEIAAKLDAKDVRGYTLEIVHKGQGHGAKVIGTCEGGTKEVTYKRG